MPKKNKPKHNSYIKSKKVWFVCCLLLITAILISFSLSALSPSSEFKIGLWTEKNIEVSDMTAFDWIGTEYITYSDKPTIDRVHQAGKLSLGILGGSDVAAGYETVKLHLASAISNGMDIFLIDEPFSNPVWQNKLTPDYLRNLFVYARQCNPDIIIVLSEIDSFRDQFIVYYDAGVRPDVVTLQAYFDLAKNKEMIDWLHVFKLNTGIDVWVWVNIAVKTLPSFNWATVGEPTADYAVKNLDGVSFYCYFTPNYPYLTSDYSFSNFPLVKAWLQTIR